MRLIVPAPGKVNLCLFLGPVRQDGRHELVTLIESVSLSDQLTVSVGGEGPDRVDCPGVPEPNLASVALQKLRARGFSGPPLTVEIVKRLPVAAGMGGGSADAAALLRAVQLLSPLPDHMIRELAADAPAGIRERARDALSELGHPPDERAERLAPNEFRRLAELLEER